MVWCVRLSAGHGGLESRGGTGLRHRCERLQCDGEFSSSQTGFEHLQVQTRQIPGRAGAPGSPGAPGCSHRRRGISERTVVTDLLTSQSPVWSAAAIMCSEETFKPCLQIRKGWGKGRSTLNVGHLGDILKLRGSETPMLEGAAHKTMSGPHDGSKIQKERNMSWKTESRLVKGNGWICN